MDGRIGRLHCRYRITADSAVAFVARLAEISREALAVSCGRSLDVLLKGDDTVWIVRRISVPMTVYAKIHWDDGALTSNWADRITIAAMREVAKGSDGTNVVRFENQADLVATFLSDLVRGQAWRHWYYGCFDRFRDQPTGAAALAVLLENRQYIASVLARLVPLGSLESLLALLSPDAKERIWRQELKGPDPLPENTLRPIFRVALRLAQSRGAIHGIDTQVADQWLHEYAHTGPVIPDWRDRSGISLAVVAALEFLWRRGYFHAEPFARVQPEESGREQAFAEFDWLNRAIVEEFFARTGSTTQAGDQDLQHKDEPSPWPARNAPRWNRLVADLAAVIAGESPYAASRLETAANRAIRLYSRLASQRAEWISDPLAIRAVEGLFAAAEWMAKAGGTWMEPTIRVLEARAAEVGIPIGRVRELLRMGRGSFPSRAMIETNFAALSIDDRVDLARICMFEFLLSGRFRHEPPERYAQLIAPRTDAESARGPAETSPRTTFSSLALSQLMSAPAGDESAALAKEFLRTFGDEGMDLAATVSAGWMPDDPNASDLATGVATRCAGAFLLLRAMTDVRLVSIARHASYPLAPCVMVLGICWAGEVAVSNGRVDTGIGLLAGQGADMTIDELRAVWHAVPASAHLRFQRELLKLLAARGVLPSAPIEINVLDLKAKGHAVVFGCGQLWPLARLVEDGGNREAVISEMADTWSDITGEQPQLVRSNEESEAALGVALETLRSGHLGLALADLTLALAANTVLRCWAMWLRGFSSSSAPYLLRNFVRRPGSITATENGFLVEMASQPLDIVLEMAGYFAPLHPRTEPWESNFTFRTRRD